MTGVRPNILWICSDQQRYDALGCYGNPFMHTPAIDRLASNGVRFEHAYAQSPVCTPSRASFLTGRYASTTRCRQNGQTIPKDEVLVTRLLSDAGYTCALSGKLHLAPAQQRTRLSGELRIEDGYSLFNWSHTHNVDPARNPTNEYYLWLQEVGVPYEAAPFEGSAQVEVGMLAEYHHTTWCAQKAINFIEANIQSGEKPWLFSLNFFDPHHPFDPPLSYLQRYLDDLDSIPLPNYEPGELDAKPTFQQRSAFAVGGTNPAFAVDTMTARDHRLSRAAYWAMIDLIDDQVNRVIEALERTGQAENTIIIYMSDHGEMLGDHGLYFKGNFFYDVAVRVPLIVSWPGVILEGRQCPALVELTDLAPTLLDAAGVEPYAGMQGQSLWPMLTGQSELNQHRDSVYSEYYNANAMHRPAIAFGTMVRTQSHKLVRTHGHEVGELYDLERDPGETHNLWNLPEHTRLKADMLALLADRMAWTADPLPPREAPW